MYVIKSSSTFDSAHFLKDYKGKCANIHGHRWIVTVDAGSEKLETEGPSRGMVVDFGQLKKDMKHETKKLDHALIIEKGSLSEKTMEAMKSEGFTIVQMDFRPTAENLAKYFYDKMTEKGYKVMKVRVFETPENVAEYYNS
ncbi:MAG: 6-carboxytetrahydropterin synthase QueD [Eubacterium sp.]|nr:6-carboxytetrahydropterin synthase QueD [Eubacterium sp.]